MVFFFLFRLKCFLKEESSHASKMTSSFSKYKISKNDYVMLVIVSVCASHFHLSSFSFFFSSQILFCWFTNPRFLLFLFFLLLFFLLLIWHLLFVRLYRQTYYCVNVKDSSTITPQPEEIHFITEVVYSVQRREGGISSKGERVRKEE